MTLTCHSQSRLLQTPFSGGNWQQRYNKGTYLLWSTPTMHVVCQPNDETYRQPSLQH